MVQTVHLTTGGPTLSFPDGMSKEEIGAILKQRFGPSSQGGIASASPAVPSFLRGAPQGVAPTPGQIPPTTAGVPPAQQEVGAVRPSLPSAQTLAGSGPLQQRLLEGVLAQSLGIKLPGPSPQQTAALKVRTATQTAANTQNLTASHKLQDDAGELLKMRGMIRNIKQILINHPNAVGPSAAIEAKLGYIGNPGDAAALGTFNANAGLLTAILTRQISSRGGSGAAKLAALAKPNSWRSVEYNKGTVDGIMQQTAEQYKEDNERYHKLTGRNLPMSLQAYQPMRGRAGAQVQAVSPTPAPTKGLTPRQKLAKASRTKGMTYNPQTRTWT